MFYFIIFQILHPIHNHLVILKSYLISVYMSQGEKNVQPDRG